MSEEVQYSRSARSRRGGRRPSQPTISSAEQKEKQETFKRGQLPVNYTLVLVWSVMIGLASVTNPLLTGLADNLQGQQLYAGFAMHNGQVPYLDFFGTSGVLYYLMLYLGSFFQTTIGISVLQALVMGVSGVYFYKIIAHFSLSEETADSYTNWFYIFVLVLGFGGLSSSFFVLPFLLTSLWFLVRYFAGAVRDESFFFFGIDAALVFLIAPKSALLWPVAFLVLMVYGIQQRQKAHGFYHFLVALFGFLLVLYSVGYYAFVQQLLGEAVKQTFIENLILDVGSKTILMSAGILVVAIVLTGFLKSFIKTILAVRGGEHRHLKWLLILTFICQAFSLVASSDFTVSHLLVLLPYGFMMGVVSLSARELGVSSLSEDYNAIRDIHYMKANFFLPVLVCLYLPMQLAFHYLQDGPIQQERKEVASYIKANSSKDDAIYVWDNSAQVYLKSQRLSTSRFVTAEPYATKKAHQASLLFDLNQGQARYVVVNTAISSLEGMDKLLEAQYIKVELELGNLALYEKK